MIKNQTIIGVADVERSSLWYQELLNCKSGHGGDEFEMLKDSKDEVFLCLHKWGEHEHPTLSDPNIPVGNGLMLYLIVEDLASIWKNAQTIKATVEIPPHPNPNSRKEQFCLRDLDGYYVIISA